MRFCPIFLSCVLRRPDCTLFPYTTLFRSYGRGGYAFGLANDGRIFISRIDLDGLFSGPLVTDTNWHHLAVTSYGHTAEFQLVRAVVARPAFDHPIPYPFDDGTCAFSAAMS